MDNPKQTLLYLGELHQRLFYVHISLTVHKGHLVSALKVTNKVYLPPSGGGVEYLKKEIFLFRYSPLGKR